MIREFTTSHEASVTIDPYRIVAFSDAANSGRIGPAASATGPLLGTTGRFGGPAGTMVDVERLGIARVQLGGTVAAGDQLTSNAAARAVKVTAAGQRVIGFAEQPGVADDIINYFAAASVAGGV